MSENKNQESNKTIKSKIENNEKYQFLILLAEAYKNSKIIHWFIIFLLTIALPGIIIYFLYPVLASFGIKIDLKVYDAKSVLLFLATLLLIIFIGQGKKEIDKEEERKKKLYIIVPTTDNTLEIAKNGYWFTHKKKDKWWTKKVQELGGEQDYPTGFIFQKEGKLVGYGNVEEKVDENNFIKGLKEIGLEENKIKKILENVKSFEEGEEGLIFYRLDTYSDISDKNIESKVQKFKYVTGDELKNYKLDDIIK